MEKQLELLARSQAAQYLGVQPSTLALWASRGRYRLPYVKVGRLVRYRREDLERWLRRRTVGDGRVEAIDEGA